MKGSRKYSAGYMNGEYPDAEAFINYHISYIRIAHFRARGKLAREVIEEIEEIYLRDNGITKAEAITTWRNTWGQNYF